MNVKLLTIHIRIVWCAIALCVAYDGLAQENAGPVMYNAALKDIYRQEKALKRITAATLPFFEDFTGYSLRPDTSKWLDNKVYVNNTMCVQPVSRGVATFDALNQYGQPYEANNNELSRYADSLTSQPIDISIYKPSDSLYLSFFYQPQGNGFFPQVKDSLMLYIKKRSGEWVRIWSVPGAGVRPFRQVMIPITDTIYFSSAFQFRFVNIAALNYSDAVWNVDYIRLNINRNINDTDVNDVGFTTNPSFMLNDYSYMPYRQFMADQQKERAGQYTDSIRNNYFTTQSVNYGYTAREPASGTPLHSSPVNNVTLPPVQTQQLSYSAYTNTVPVSGMYDRVVFENKYYIESLGASDPKGNDTIVQEQVFDNCLAYDDGTAEQSYYLTQYISLPAKMAIEFHLNQPDTLRGLAIYFGRQAPRPDLKYFSIVIYKNLQGVNGAGSDEVYYQEDDFVPGYAQMVNGFWEYKLKTPVVLPTGIFYVGTIQPAYGMSDSLYFGLDKNRTANNHVYYNVGFKWNSSGIKGAVMVRPLIGQEVFPTEVPTMHQNKAIAWSVSPNPAGNYIQLHYASSITDGVFAVSDIQGRRLLTGYVNNNRTIDISSLTAGMYFVHLQAGGLNAAPQKIIKQ